MPLFPRLSRFEPFSGGRRGQSQTRLVRSVYLYLVPRPHPARRAALGEPIFLCSRTHDKQNFPRKAAVPPGGWCVLGGVERLGRLASLGWTRGDGASQPASRPARQPASPPPPAGGLGVPYLDQSFGWSDSRVLYYPGGVMEGAGRARRARRGVAALGRPALGGAAIPSSYRPLPCPPDGARRRKIKPISRGT